MSGEEVLHMAIAGQAAEIERFFKDDVKVTILVRNLTRPNANVMVTNDPNEADMVTSWFRSTLNGATINPRGNSTSAVVKGGR